MKTNFSAYQRMPQCPCTPQETSIRDVQLAVSYVPFQKFCGIMSPYDSLCKGTAFAELFSPYKKRDFSNVEQEVCRVAGAVKEEDYCHDE